MSGVAKAIRKIFVPLAVLAGAAFGLPALAGASGIFTAGAAGGAAAGTSVLTTVLKQGARQALVGGVLSKVSGGSFVDGAKMGALTGAVTGAIGGFGAPAQGAAGRVAAAPAGAIGTAAVAAPPLAAAPAATGFGAFLSNPIVGNVLQGAAQGFLAKAQQVDQEKALRRAEDRIRDSYDGASDALMPDGPAGSQPEMQRTRFDRETPGAQRYRWNAETKRVELG